MKNKTGIIVGLAFLVVVILPLVLNTVNDNTIKKSFESQEEDWQCLERTYNDWDINTDNLKTIIGKGEHRLLADDIWAEENLFYYYDWELINMSFNVTDCFEKEKANPDCIENCEIVKIKKACDYRVINDSQNQTVIENGHSSFLEVDVDYTYSKYGKECMREGLNCKLKYPIIEGNETVPLELEQRVACYQGCKFSLDENYSVCINKCENFYTTKTVCEKERSRNAP